MSWLSLLLALLRVADSLTGYLREKGLLDAGASREIALSTASILKKAGVAKRIWEEVNELKDDEVDAMLRGLEPSRDVRPPDGR